MRTFYSALAAIVFGLVFWLGPAGLDASDMPPADGPALYNYLTKQDPYEQWELWPGTHAMQEGSRAHGEFVNIYVNKLALESIQAGQMPVQEGSIVLKENFDPSKTLTAVTLMYKKAGFDPDNGDWFYLSYAPDGTIQAEGKVGDCMDCHARVANKDWLFSWK
ncbi:cytochrome P460 family protein [Oceanidesulfovibrio marinus]|nr:cytochrome P460 family protein [Oceanidesulfovibrio marinus]